MGNCSGNCCGHENHNHGDDKRKIYLTLEDESKLECDVLDIFEIDGNDYIAVLPLNSDTALLYRFSESNGQVSLSNIESDTEYALVGEIFMQNMNSHIHEN